MTDALVQRVRRNRLLRLGLVSYRHRGLRPSDVVLASYPKSGNTWLKFMLIYLMTGRDAQFLRATSGEPIPALGWQRGAAALLPSGGRVVKSHEPFKTVYGRRYRRAVYMLRDGRDVAVSYYHYYGLARGSAYGGDFSDFLETFLAGRADGYGSWQDHVRSWLGSPPSRRGDLLVVRYEHLLANPPAVLAEVADFLGLGADRVRIAEAVERNTVQRMRVRWEGSELRTLAPGSPSFVRRAEAGGWRGSFSERDRDRFQAEAGDLLSELGYATDP